MRTKYIAKKNNNCIYTIKAQKKPIFHDRVRVGRSLKTTPRAVLSLGQRHKAAIKYYDGNRRRNNPAARPTLVAATA